jgi:4-hydroxy-tetrahydrodipicolinate reductase
VKIGLFGFGRTGHLVAEEIIKNPDCELVWVVRKTKQHNHENASDFLGYPHSEQGYFFTKEEASHPDFYRNNPVDAIIDFSSPNGVYEYARAADFGIHIVSAVSHYEEAAVHVFEELAKKTAVLHSANITLGVNFLLVASQALKQIMPRADVEIVEEHFREKKGASGTALKLAEKLELDPETRVNSIRVGGIVGNHEVVFGLPYQTIRLKHEVISRAAFGAGAIYAAQMLENADPGLYTMEGLMHKSFVEKLAVNKLLE